MTWKHAMWYAIFTVVVVPFFMAYHISNAPVEPTLTDAEVTIEYTRLLKERNDALRELLDLYDLRILEAEGKLHSS